MKTQSRDTHRETERVLIGLIRQKTSSQKFAQVRAFSRTVMQLSRRAIARANPNLSEQEVDLLFVSYHYGEHLAERLRTYLENIHHEKS